MVCNAFISKFNLITIHDYKIICQANCTAKKSSWPPLSFGYNKTAKSEKKRKTEYNRSRASANYSLIYDTQSVA